jgi:catechol 2,3-dioxygenase-like lactoylglutathione lyase family enzyme
VYERVRRRRAEPSVAAAYDRACLPEAERSCMREPVFTETKQIALVVRDLEATMRTYVHEYGIGPWEIYEFNPDTVSDMVPTECAYRLAVTMVGSVQWELIQPLDDASIYAEFLATRGEGLHHVAVDVPDYGAALDTMRAKGRRLIQGGHYGGATFAYLSTDEDLGVITEIFDWPEDLPPQEPDAVYP